MAHIESDLAYLATATLCAIAGSVFDIRSRRIPNLLTAPAFLLGLVIHLAAGGWIQFFTALAGALIAGAVFLVFYLAGGMGAGDVKLMLAVGCIAGLSNVAYLLILTAISGGVMAICLALARGRLRQTLSNVVALTSHHTRRGIEPHPELNLSNSLTLRLPYALAIAGGSILTLYFQAL